MNEDNKTANQQEKPTNTDDHPDYTKYPEGHIALLPMLDFLPNDEAKYGLLAGFTFFTSLM